MSKSLLCILLFVLLASCRSGDWRTASRESVGIAPKAADLKEDIFQIYTARAFSWRGYFGVHPWVAWKELSDKEYSVAQVIGWRLRRGKSAVDVHQGLPDKRWFNSDPKILLTLRGKAATDVIKQVKELVKSYPYADQYRVWPGPNSNTFIDYIISNVPELKIELPPTAIGKEFLTNGSVIDWTSSGTGVRTSLFGVVGFSLGLAEGVELNLFGFHFGVDFVRPALKIPFIGRVGFADANL